MQGDAKSQGQRAPIDLDYLILIFLLFTFAVDLSANRRCQKSAFGLLHRRGCFERGRFKARANRHAVANGTKSLCLLSIQYCLSPLFYRPAERAMMVYSYNLFIISVTFVGVMRIFTIWHGMATKVAP